MKALQLPKFSGGQTEAIIDKLVPLIAAEEDQEFFKGVLFVAAEDCKSSAAFAVLVQRLLAGPPE